MDYKFYHILKELIKIYYKNWNKNFKIYIKLKKLIKVKIFIVKWKYKITYVIIVV